MPSPRLGARGQLLRQRRHRRSQPRCERSDEALALRNRVSSQYEPATWADDDIERRCLLGCVVVGGGPTGVVFIPPWQSWWPRCGVATTIAASSTTWSSRSWRHCPRRSLPTIGGSSCERCARSEQRHTGDLGCSGRRGHRRLHPSRRRTALPAATVVWAAGVTVAPLATQLSTGPARTRAGARHAPATRSPGGVHRR